MCGPQVESASPEVAAVVESTRPTQAIASRVFLRKNGTIVIALGDGSAVYVPVTDVEKPWPTGEISAAQLAELGHVELTPITAEKTNVSVNAVDAGDVILPGFSKLSPDNQASVIDSFLHSRGLSPDDSSLVMEIVHGIQTQAEAVLRNFNSVTGGRLQRIGNPYDILHLAVTLLGAAYAGTPMLQVERENAAFAARVAGGLGGYVN